MEKSNINLLMKKLIIFSFIVVMIITTATSLVYWISGIHGNNEYKLLSVNIGEGNAVTTVVTLSDNSDSLAGKTLIPYTRTPQADEINKAEFKIKVTWTGSDDSTNDLAKVSGKTGKLTVHLRGVYLGGNNIIDELGHGEEPLFIVTFDRSYYDIVGNDANGVNVTITVKLAEPKDREQYLKIIGEQVDFRFEFVVESEYDLMVGDSGSPMII